MKDVRCLLYSALVSLAFAGPAGAASVVINEVMYHPGSDNLLESYVELYNPGAAAVDLSGWRFTKGLQFEFPTNASIGASNYLAVAADGAAFTRKYPGVTNFVAGWLAPMSSHLVLADRAGALVSEVNYSNDGDWAARVLTTGGPNAFGHAGWEWLAPHDGQGSSLELINPNLSNEYALNWGSSSALNGTPGRANSLFQTNLAPIITGVAHSPVVPQRNDPVTVSAKIVDEEPSGTAVTLFYRVASNATPSVFTGVPMFDDGAHNDGLAGDGLFAAIVAPKAAGTIVEFYLQARDSKGNERAYPKVIAPANSVRTANLLYQVDEGVYTGSQPIYRVIMTEMERQELYQIGTRLPRHRTAMPR